MLYLVIKLCCFLWTGKLYTVFVGELGKKVFKFVHVSQIGHVWVLLLTK